MSGTFLLDTHVLLWWVLDDPRLSRLSRDALADDSSRLLWSVASTWELAIKANLGRLRFEVPLGRFLDRHVEEQGLEILGIEQAHALRVESLPRLHRDPFDRMLVAQSLVESIPLLSADPRFAEYGVDVVW